MKKIIFTIIIVIISSCKNKEQFSNNQWLSSGCYIPSIINWDTLIVEENFKIKNEIFDIYLVKNENEIFRLRGLNEAYKDSILIGVENLEISKCKFDQEKKIIFYQNVHCSPENLKLSIDSLFDKETSSYRNNECFYVNNVNYTKTDKFTFNEDVAKIIKNIVGSTSNKND